MAMKITHFCEGYCDCRSQSFLFLSFQNFNLEYTSVLLVYFNSNRSVGVVNHWNILYSFASLYLI